MNAQMYAHALYRATRGKDEATQRAYTESLVTVLKKRGHESLLPAILASFTRATEKKGVKTVITVAREEDAAEAQRVLEEYATEFDTAQHEVAVDDTIIGGYVIRGNDKILDRSFKSALLNLYQKVTQ